MCVACQHTPHACVCITKLVLCQVKNNRRPGHGHADPCNLNQGVYCSQFDKSEVLDTHTSMRHPVCQGNAGSGSKEAQRAFAGHADAYVVKWSHLGSTIFKLE